MDLLQLNCIKCGGDVDYNEKTGTCKCRFCDSIFHIQKKENDTIIQLNLANQHRNHADFEEAIKAYDAIIASGEEGYEAYWGRVLSEYGVRFVLGEYDSKYKFTCDRTLANSILDNWYYQKALELADEKDKQEMQENALEIDRLQKEIKEKMDKEEAFDVFISYKATYSKDKIPTEDSVIGRRIYDELTQRGIKVFFSSETLKGKLGSEYEPIIFKALNTAKIMILIATKEEFIYSPWVKNEWSRFSKRVEEEGMQKACFPVFKDVNPYAFPPRFRTQGLDINKHTFDYEIVTADGIANILGFGQVDKTLTRKDIESLMKNKLATIESGISIIDPLLQRGSIDLEHCDFEGASRDYDKVLDKDPENVDAYFGLFLAKNEYQSEEELSNYAYVDFSNLYMKSALEFARKNENNEALEKFKNIISRVVDNTYNLACQALQDDNPDFDLAITYINYCKKYGNQDKIKEFQDFEIKLIERKYEIALYYLENEDFDKAKVALNFCIQYNPNDARFYFAKFMCDIGFVCDDDFIDVMADYSNNENYKMALYKANIEQKEHYSRLVNSCKINLINDKIQNINEEYNKKNIKNEAILTKCYLFYDEVTDNNIDEFKKNGIDYIAECKSNFAKFDEQIYTEKFNKLMEAINEFRQIIDGASEEKKNIELSVQDAELKYNEASQTNNVELLGQVCEMYEKSNQNCIDFNKRLDKVWSDNKKELKREVERYNISIKNELSHLKNIAEDFQLKKTLKLMKIFTFWGVVLVAVLVFLNAKMLSSQMIDLSGKLHSSLLAKCLIGYICLLYLGYIFDVFKLNKENHKGYYLTFAYSFISIGAFCVSIIVLNYNVKINHIIFALICISVLMLSYKTSIKGKKYIDLKYEDFGAFYYPLISYLTFAGLFLTFAYKFSEPMGLGSIPMFMGLLVLGYGVILIIKLLTKIINIFIQRKRAVLLVAKCIAILNYFLFFFLATYM